MPLIEHISKLDPDYRRQPKTDYFCCLCQRDIKGEAAGWLHFVGGGMQEITDSLDFTAPDDLGCFPVGQECARKVTKTLGAAFLIPFGVSHDDDAKSEAA